MWSRVVAVLVLSAALAGRSGTAFARMGGGKPEDSCLSGEAIEFAAGSAELDRAAAGRLDDAAAWIEGGAGRYAYLAVPGEAAEPLGPARLQAAAARLTERGVDPRAVRPTSLAVLEPKERQTLAGAPLVVKTCVGPPPYARDWTRPPEGDGIPRQGLGRATVIGVLLGLWVVGPGTDRSFRNLR
jgi:hypothetical protein